MSELTLTEKLIKAQSELKAPKGQYNSFSKFKYRSAEDILEAVKPINATYGLLLTLTDEPILIGDWYYLKSTASITDGKDNLVITAYARESENKKGMDHSQITGAASSYARKYALNGLYLIDDTKDADTDQYQQQQNAPNNKSNHNTQNKPKTQAPAKLSATQKSAIETKSKEFAKLRNQTVGKVMEVLNISDLNLITASYAEKSIATLDGWLKKASEANDVQSST